MIDLAGTGSHWHRCPVCGYPFACSLEHANGASPVLLCWRCKRTPAVSRVETPHRFGPEGGRAGPSQAYPSVGE